MPDFAYVLSPTDRDKIKDLVDESKYSYEKRPKLLPQAPLPDAPDVFIAKSPVATVPALAGTTPGSVRCDIYRVSDSGLLIQLGTVTQLVYNLSTSAIAAGTYFRVTRDKLGFWIADYIAAGSADHGWELNSVSNYSAIAGGDTRTLNWDGEAYDTDAYHSLVSNTSRATIPTGLGGKYMVGFALSFSGGGAPGPTFGVGMTAKIVSSGSVTPVPVGGVLKRALTTNQYFMSQCLPLNLAAGATVEVSVTTDDASGFNSMGLNGTPLFFGQKVDKAG